MQTRSIYRLLRRFLLWTPVACMAGDPFEPDFSPEGVQNRIEEHLVNLRQRESFLLLLKGVSQIRVLLIDPSALSGADAILASTDISSAPDVNRVKIGILEMMKHEAAPPICSYINYRLIGYDKDATEIFTLNLSLGCTNYQMRLVDGVFSGGFSRLDILNAYLSDKLPIPEELSNFSAVIERHSERMNLQSQPKHGEDQRAK